MEKQRSVRVMTLTSLIIALVGVTVAFAAMSTTLIINGTAKMETATWKIKFVEGSLQKSTTGEASVTTEPTLSDTSLETFEIILTMPGDSVTYNFDVLNDGSIDAKIGTLIKNGTEVLADESIPLTCTGLAEEPTLSEADAILVCENLSYTLTYTSGGASVKKDDTLASQETKNLTLTLSYSGSSLPTADVEITGLDITIIYVQD